MIDYWGLYYDEEENFNINIEYNTLVGETNPYMPVKIETKYTKKSVAQGETIAYSGNTGNSFGPHVHFELWINGSTVNPLNYVNKN